MQRVWTNRNVDLKIFNEKIRQFFEQNEFETKTEEIEGTYHIVASGSTEYTIEGQVTVTVKGNPQDLLLTLELQKKSKPRKYSMPMTLSTALGFGFLLRDEFKTDEEFLELKKDLWAFADKTVIDLTDSANVS